MKFSAYIYKYKQKGNLVWVYRPFFNYRNSTTKELQDFQTDELKFDINHPVTLLPQLSYDGSVNLIINDGVSYPKLINSRFSVTGKSTYEIVDRKGDNDTNIYDEGTQFEIDASLYKLTTKIPQIKYTGTSAGGNLKIGNYFFYFKFSDADGNETDFIGQSGLVSLFMGEGTYTSVNTGQKNQNSTKCVRFQISNIDTAYNYISVYYTRTSAEASDNASTEHKQIQKRFPITNAYKNNIIINGYEPTIDVAFNEINNKFALVDAAKAEATCSNILFLGNIKKPEIPYEELRDLSLHVIPEFVTEKDSYFAKSDDTPYSLYDLENSYCDSEFIYNYTGYAPGEIYRFGIVYIMNNGELSPVFNIRGGYIQANTTHTIVGIRHKVEYNEADYSIKSQHDSHVTHVTDKNFWAYENAKGVVRFDGYNDYIYGVKFKVHEKSADNKLLTEEDEDGLIADRANTWLENVAKYCKGFFFVRQKRLPLVLAQGLTIGVDKTARTPTIPTVGAIDTFVSGLGYTHTETDNVQGIHYISEGFMTRYTFSFERKKSGLFGAMLKIATVVVLAAAVVVGTVYGGVGGVAAMSALHMATAGMTVAGAATIASTAATIAGITAAAAAVTTVAAAGLDATINALNSLVNSGSTKLNGRATETPSGFEKKETDKSRRLDGDFNDRIIFKDPSKNKVQAIICPEFAVNPAKFNQYFSGDKHYIETVEYNNQANYLRNEGRHFYPYKYGAFTDVIGVNAVVVPIDDSQKVAAIKDYKWRGRAGDAEEAYKYETIGTEFDEDEEKKINSDIIRGNYGAYLGFTNPGDVIDSAKVVNIYIPNFKLSSMKTYFQIREQDTSPFYAISKRFDLSELLLNNYIHSTTLDGAVIYDSDKGIPYIGLETVYGGDSYICEFTQRIIRNFNDPSAPYNDLLVDECTWKDNYDPAQPENYNNINSGDVNGVQLGMWLTFRLRTTYNLNIRTLDGSYTDEATMTGHPRTYYPHNGMSTEGTYKVAESRVHNLGFATSVSSQVYFEEPDVPALKNWFGTRIMYSDIHVNDAFKNGFRVFQGTHFVDYTREYGEITELISMKNSLLVIFEHGLGVLPVNPAVTNEATQLTGQKVIPNELIVISDMYGTQWKDSVVKTQQYVYGVDTVAKKIWRTNGQTVEGISDMHVQEFLNNNLSLTESEKEPIIGIRNVASFYNAYKNDVMFTFYDSKYTFDEVAWNLCYNETLDKFITFYSWIPSMMQNIDNIPFSFNRETTKLAAKIGVSLNNNYFSDGIVYSKGYIITTTTTTQVDEEEPTSVITVRYSNTDNGISGETYNSETKTTTTISSTSEEIWKLDVENRTIPENCVIKYALQRDPWGNYKKFSIEPINRTYIDINGESKTEQVVYDNKPVYQLIWTDSSTPDEKGYYLYLQAQLLKIDESDIYYNTEQNKYSDLGYYESLMYFVTNPDNAMPDSDFWKHGHAGIIDIKDDILPAKWYGKQHPFEFEFIVNESPEIHKIFTNLEIISNNVQPESFHFEIIGDCYDFAKDKPNMYFRQEATKALWQYNGMDITYDHDFIKVYPKQQARSAELIKTYYERQDELNLIEDYYVHINSQVGGLQYDYRHLTGAEIVRYPTRQEYRIWQHQLAISLNNLAQDDARSLITGNCYYKEDKWYVTINPILVCYKNEYGYPTSGKRINPSNTTWWAAIKYYDANTSDGTQTIVAPIKSSITYDSDKYGVVQTLKLFDEDLVNRTYPSDYIGDDYLTKIINSDGTATVTRWKITQYLPPLTIYNSALPTAITTKGEIDFPDKNFDYPNDSDNIFDAENSLYNRYNNAGQLDTSKWVNDNAIYHTNFGYGQNRKEIDLKDRFMKVRIRYTGDQLAIIDYINTIYQESYS